MGLFRAEIVIKVEIIIIYSQLSYIKSLFKALSSLFKNDHFDNLNKQKKSIKGYCVCYYLPIIVDESSIQGIHI